MSTEIAKKVEAVGLQNFKEELKRQALAAAGQEASVGGQQFFSVKGGRLSFNKDPIPGSQMDVIILDAVCENVYYEGVYDPDNFAPPTCFAFGRAEATMAPHASVTEPKCASCAKCPLNEWGSAPQGKGKACKNKRRLACISVPKNSDGVAQEIIGHLSLAPTQVSGWGQYVNSLAHGPLEMPPRAVVTRVKVEPDTSAGAKSPIKISFGLVAPVSDELLGAVLKRGTEYETQIMFPYTTNKDGGATTKAAPAAAKKGRKY